MPRPSGRSRQTNSRGPYNYYLEDHPFLVPLLILVLGGLCLYLTIFSSILRDWIIGPDADRTKQGQFYTAIGWAIAFVLAGMIISAIFLTINLVDLAIRRSRKAPAQCPVCGLVEGQGANSFERERVAEGWEILTCSNCQNRWHSRRL